jgi:CelD/BcsL family acetyltransferase involved in cellulose biosynthesis
MQADVLILQAGELPALVPEWEALAAGALEPNPFYEHWMLLPAIEAYGQDAELTFVTVRVRGKLAGFFPLERVRRYRGFPADALRLWQHRHILLATPLLDAECAGEAVRAFLEWLQAGGAPLLELRYLPAGGAFHCVLLNALNELRLPATMLEGYTRAALRRGPDSQADAEKYLRAAMSGDTLKRLRKKARRLAEQGAAAHVVLAPGDDAARWIDELLRIEASGWKGERGGALACTEQGRRFAHATLGEAFRRGRLFMLGIDLDGRAIARCCGIFAGSGAFAWKTAYDEAYADYSPGALTEVDRIRWFHTLPATRWMDSFTLPGNKRLEIMWKDRIAVQDLLIGFGARGAALAALLPAARWAKAKTRSLLHDAGSRLRELLRRHRPTSPIGEIVNPGVATQTRASR